VRTELGVFSRYARGLPRFFRTTVTAASARRLIAEQHARRDASFLQLLERAVYGGRDNPYRALLAAAGAELGDVRRLVDSHGLEEVLRRLHDAGVYVTLDEFKGRQPIERLGVDLAAGSTAFDNPLLARHFEAATGGTRGVRRRVFVDLDLLAYETSSQLLMREGYGAGGRPFAVWRPVLPSSSGINNCLRQSKLGEPVAAWFNPYDPPRAWDALAFRVFTDVTIVASRIFGAGIAAPEPCHPEQAERVARWLADCKRRGRPGVLDTQAALGVRVCLAAQAAALDISGSVLGMGGEPYTEEKHAAVSAAGCRVYCTYSMTEAGRIAVGCADGDVVDDMHLLSDKLAVLQRDRVIGSTSETVGALYYTALLPSSPKLMINVESDDYAVLSDRECRCPFGRLGLTQHIREVRSYEKLTAEGNHFLGSDLVALVDRVLPGRFGGGPTDYQLVEEEIDGLPKVSVVARPELGQLDDAAVVEAVLAHLGEVSRNRLMVDVWRAGGTVRVVRREPYVTAAGKILSLHLLKR